MHEGMCGTGGWFFGMGHLVFWVFAVILIIALVRLARGRGWHCGHGQGHVEDTALDILKKRYARGEISAEEFEKIKKDVI